MKTLEAIFKFPLLTQLEQLMYKSFCTNMLDVKKLNQEVAQKINDAFNNATIQMQNDNHVFCFVIETQEEYEMILSEAILSRDCLANDAGFNPYDYSPDQGDIIALTDIISRLGLFRLAMPPVLPLYDKDGRVIRY